MSAAVLTKVGDELHLNLKDCRGSEFADAKEKIREIPGRSFDWDTKMWIVPADAQNADRILKTIRPKTTDEITSWVQEAMMGHEESLTTPLPDDAELLIPWANQRMPWQPKVVNEEEFNGALPYQRAAIDKMAEVGSTILADDMGLGKTFEAISAVTERLLRCCYEAGSLLRVGEEQSGRASQALSSLLAALSGQDQRLDPEREGEAMRRLWDRVAAADHGLGSCARGEVVFAWTVDEGQGPGRFLVAYGSDPSRDWEVRGTLPELSPTAALSLGPKLVVAPSSVKGSWERELRRWLPDDTPVKIIKGTYTKTKTMTAEQRRQQDILDGIAENAWIIVNWEQLRVVKEKVKTRNGGRRTVTRLKEPLFEQTNWTATVADEAHRAKNPNAQQTRGLWRCTGWTSFAATGTPIMNSPDEIWSLLRWLWPNEFHEQGMKRNAIAYWSFYNDYVDYYEDHRGKKVITGVKNPDALRFVLKDKLIRRTAEILGLKGRKRIIYDIDLNSGQQKLYDEAETAMWLAVAEDIAEGNKDAIEFAKAAIEGDSVANLIRIPNGAARLVRLRQITENAALLGGKDDSAVMDDFEQKFVDSNQAQWVVFCAFKESCEILAERLRTKYGVNVGVYNGDVKPAARTELEDAFQRGEIDVMIGTIDAMREGITLTGGRRQFWLSRAFVPAWNEQGEARSDRLGQQHQVLVYVPQALGTVAADKVDPINRLKESIVRAILPQIKIKEATT